jgi:hypothetical protein
MPAQQQLLLDGLLEPKMGLLDIPILVGFPGLAMAGFEPVMNQ